MTVSRQSICLHRFGQGRGMGAELMELAWLSYRCRLLGIEFALQSDDRPEGVSCSKGWEDYFAPFFNYIRIPDSLARLNSHYYSLFGQKIRKPLARLMLNQAVQRSCFYTFDPQTIARKSDEQSINIGVPTVSVTDHFIPAFRPNKALAEEINTQILQFGIQKDKFICMHVRRGDKITEAQYIEYDLYIEHIRRLLGCERLPICIMSDSESAIEDVSRLLTRYDVVSLSRTRLDGYDQGHFNDLPAEIRLRRSFDFLTEFEIARRSRFFLGTRTSNVLWLMRILHSRGQNGVIEVDSPGDS